MSVTYNCAYYSKFKYNVGYYAYILAHYLTKSYFLRAVHIKQF